MAIFDNYTNNALNNVVGNNIYSDDSAGYKSEVKHVFESYSSEGVDFANDMNSIIANPTGKAELISNVL